MFDPGSYRGDSPYDLVGPNRMLDRVRNRVQDHYTGNEETLRAEEEAREAAREKKAADRRNRQMEHPSLSERLHDWWVSRSKR